jgi:hypothetical protein
VLEAELQRNVADLPGALFGLQADGTPELGKRRALLGAPVHDLEATSRAHHGQVVANQPEREVVRDDIRPRQEHQQT